MRLRPTFSIVCLPVLLTTFSAAKAEPSRWLAQSPFRFEPDSGNGFAARGLNYRLFLTSSSFHLNWDGPTGRSSAIDLKLAGANPRARLEGVDRLPSQTSYFTGADSSAWRPAVPNYARVRLRDVYPGMDLVFYGSQGSIEFDFELAPGADPRTIRIDVRGSRPRIQDGALVLANPSGEVRWSKPVIYQTVDGARRPVPGSFAVQSRGRIGFELGAYDRTRALVIDPVLNFSTYFGGIGNEATRGIGVDGSGNIYIAGYTTSRSLPVSTNAVQAAYGGQTASYQTGDGFVAKFSSTGSLLAMTYLGGSRDDLASSLAVDAAGNVYTTGYTNSPDFPLTSRAYQQRMAGAGGNALFTIGDAFVTKLNSSLSQIVYSTYLGGTKDEAGIAIATDSAGNAYVTGITLSTDFPTTSGAVQTTYRGSGGQPITDFDVPFFVTGDAFIAKLNPDGSQLTFSTYLGGSLDDAATAIAVDASGNVYVGGFTISRNFPTTAQAMQTTFKGIEIENEFYNLGDGFIAKLNPTGTTLQYSTYLGGRGDDAIAGIAVDAAGSVYATGATTSSDFPITAGAFRTTHSGPLVNNVAERIIGDGFALKLKPDGTGLVYGTFIGGSGDDSGKAIAIDSAGNAYVAGNTASANFALTPDATQRVFAGAGGFHNNNDLTGDGFVVVLDPSGAREVFATFIGGSMDDTIQGIALDASRNMHVTGGSMSANFPSSAGAYQSRFGGIGATGRVYGDAFIAKFSSTTQLSSTPAGIAITYAIGSPKPAAVSLAISAPAASPFTVTAAGGAWLSVSPATGTTPASVNVTIDPGGLAAGTYNATLTIATTAAGVSSATVPVVLTVSGTGSLPVFTAAGVVNSASSVAGPIAPGEIIVVYGVNLGPSAIKSAELASDGRVASILAGTRVLFDGVPAPLIYTSSGQLSAVVPYAVAGKTNTQMQVEYNGVLSAAVPVPVAAAAPGLFTTNQQGTGQAAALNQDNSYNTSASPAAVGSIVVLFGTGEGQTRPALADGTVANAVVPQPVLPVSATVGGAPASVKYAGTAPGFVVGALQLNIEIPAGTPSGNAQVIITVGNASSPAVVTVAVR